MASPSCNSSMFKLRQCVPSGVYHTHTRVLEPVLSVFHSPVSDSTMMPAAPSSFSLVNLAACFPQGSTFPVDSGVLTPM